MTTLDFKDKFNIIIIIIIIIQILIHGKNLAQLPKLPEAALAGGQFGQGGEHLLQNQLPVLLIPGKHLRKRRGWGRSIDWLFLNSIIFKRKPLAEMQKLATMGRDSLQSPAGCYIAAIH